VIEVDRPFDVVVDLGYTENSVSSTLATVRSVAAARGGRLLTVLAVVGREAARIAPGVAAVARRGSDHLILSSTSYYGEPRLLTLEQLLAGARAAEGGSFEAVIDRRAAIGRGLGLARPGDLVAVLGRGATMHESTDARGGFRHLNDREIVLELA
jgi:UDP-N-acetylmuramoyl-L-alanyl-D-glutamate--2,6-diaminopimelate ligase